MRVVITLPSRSRRLAVPTARLSLLAVPLSAIQSSNGRLLPAWGR